MTSSTPPPRPAPPSDPTAAAAAPSAVEEELARLRLMADNLPVMLAHYRAGDDVCLYANAPYAAAFGFTPQTIVGRNFAEVIGEAATREIRPRVDRVLREGVTVTYERRLERPGRPARTLEVTLKPHHDAQGRVDACFVLITDISRHRRDELALRESEDRLATFMEASVEGIVFHDEGRITDANPAICQLIGVPLAQLLGRDPMAFIAPEVRARTEELVRTGTEARYESLVMHAQGHRIPVEFIGRTLMRGGRRLRMSIVRDIRDRLEAQARIHYLAHHDALTRLPNRDAFMEHLRHRMQDGADGHPAPPFALLFLDLDHFKRVNDSLGHLAGDALLVTVARRLQEVLGDADRAARFGGDEFMVMLGRPGGRAEVEAFAQTLLRALGRPLILEGRPIVVTPSVGVALFPDDALDAEALIKHADTAMYQAKTSGRARVSFFDPATALDAYHSLVLEGQLAHAIEREEFMLHVQPQVDLRDGRVVGSETLIRWQHPERGLLSPEEFIELAEQHQLMVPIGQWVLREAMRCARRWHEAGGAGLPVAVNLSARQFDAPGFVDQVESLLATEGVQGRWIELEVTERMLMSGSVSVLERLVRLRRMGIRMSIDDFGTGWSSLAQLKNLPIDKMKIDRSFVRDLQHEDGAAITAAIVQMGRSLDLTVVAEGVETRAQAEALSRLGCDLVQGNLVSPPLPVIDFPAWVAARAAAGAGPLGG
jgi:diguanylate cyclase (GGDEF)-like protein/PAS domain S-box-containing protein